MLELSTCGHVSALSVDALSRLGEHEAPDVIVTLVLGPLRRQVAGGRFPAGLLSSFAYDRQHVG